MKKTSPVSKKAQEAIKNLEAIQKELIEAQQADAAAVASVKERISGICGEEFFCGVQLGPEELASIIKLAIETGEAVRIPYNIYFNND